MSDIIQHPSVILIIGRRRYGKSALGHYICQKFHYEKPTLKIYVVSLPKQKHHLLPEWIKPVDDIEQLPDNCIALIDEGAMKYHAHKWNKKETEVMDRMISISGQRKQTFIFITHTMRKFAVTLLLDINILLVKKPSLLQMKLERSQFRKLIEEIDREFNKLPKQDVKSSVYVVSDDYKGMIRNPLPEHWSEELSEAYAGIKLNKEQQEIEEIEEIKPFKINRGITIWFKKTDTKIVVDTLQKNSLMKNKLSYERDCIKDCCNFSLDLELYNNFYYISGIYQFNVEKTLKELDYMNIKYFIEKPEKYKDIIILTPLPKEKKKEKEEKNIDKIYNHLNGDVRE